MKRTPWAVGISLVLALAAAAAGVPAAQAAPEKVLRYAFPVAETGMDPAQVSDLYSRILTANIFDALYSYDYLARPARVTPVLADGMPEVSSDFRTYTVKLRRGIYFADDPAFGGKKREVTAEDVVYTYKRHFDPKNKSPSLSMLEEEKILGLADLQKKAQATGKFDYDTRIDGIQAVDRYTVQFKLAAGSPRLIYNMADPGILGIVAREVVERYGDRIMEHPVGTGPFMLQEWRRSSRITLVRNPAYREEYYAAQPGADDASAQAIMARMKGKRLPIVDKVVVSIIDEPQPRWLSFLNNEQDLMYGVPASFATQAIPNNRLAPNLVKRGMQMERVPGSDITITYFRMDDPVVGGYSPEKVALRRAIALAYNSEEEVRLARRGQAIVAQGLIMPNTLNFDPKFRTEMGAFDRARAIALLDLFGYTDQDGDGWRDMPDGKPLVLEYSTQGSSDSREYNEIWKKNMNAIGVKIVFKVAKWPEQLKAARAGKLMMWGLGYSATSPNSGYSLDLGYSKSIGQSNFARFNLKAYDDLYQKQIELPDGPERAAVLRDSVRLLVAYMPYKIHAHRIITDVTQPWLIGYKRHPMAREFWRYVDIDTDLLNQRH